MRFKQLIELPENEEILLDDLRQINGTDDLVELVSFTFSFFFICICHTISFEYEQYPQKKTGIINQIRPLEL